MNAPDRYPKCCKKNALASAGPSVHETLDEAILHGLSRCDEVPIDGCVLAPSQLRIAGEFGAMVGHDHFWLAASLDDCRQFPSDAPSRNRCLRNDVQPFVGRSSTMFWMSAGRERRARRLRTVSPSSGQSRLIRQQDEQPAIAETLSLVGEIAEPATQSRRLAGGRSETESSFDPRRQSSRLAVHTGLIGPADTRPRRSLPFILKEAPEAQLHQASA